MNAGSRPSITIMPEEILKKTIKEVAALQLDRIEFDWHGGEPLIAKSDFLISSRWVPLFSILPLSRTNLLSAFIYVDMRCDITMVVMPSE